MRRIVVALVALALLTVPGIAPAAAPASCPGDNGAPTKVVTGTFGTQHEGYYVLVPFDVPADSTKVRVKLCYDQPESPLNSQIRHTLDLGIYDAAQADGFHDEEEFRGWGGSSRLNAFVSPDNATVGFKPGSIPAGEWAGEIGVAAVAGQEEGDLTGEVEWRMEIFIGADPADADQPWQPTPYDDGVVKEDAAWYKGDFHVHAEHSNPSDATMRETFDYAFGPRPAGAGLDFITLSDYVTDRHWDEIGRFQPDYPNSLIMRSAEIITYRGHINNHDSHTFVDYRTGPIYEFSGGQLVPVRDAQPASRIFDDIHSAGGFTQVNHPTTFPSTVPGFANICRGCSWEYTDEETQWSKVDSFEVATGPGGFYDPDGNEPGPNPFSPAAIEWWDRLHTEGFDITGVGSSDSHHAGEENATQSPIGEATTVVYADELSEDGIHEAVLKGHAYVKFFSSDGPDLRLDAQPVGGGDSVMMGDTLFADGGNFTARVIGGAPSPQVRSLIVMRDGAPMSATPVDSNDFIFNFSASTPGDYRLQLERGSATEALTNPITLSNEEPPPDPPENTTLSFTDATDLNGQFTDTAHIEARLVESESGDALWGAPVEFKLTGKKDSIEWTETTDSNGVAKKDVLLNVATGPYALTAQYAGTSNHHPSADSQGFKVKKEDAAIDLTTVERDGKAYLEAHLYDGDTPSRGLRRRGIEFFVNGNPVGVAYTNADGVAAQGVRRRHLTFGNTLAAEFDGTRLYRAARDELQVP